MKIKIVRRGHYWHAGKELYISGISEYELQSTAAHEMMHRFERTVEGFRSAERELYDRRIKGEKLRSIMGTSKEQTYRDEWGGDDREDYHMEYMGRYYNGSAYEICTMNIESLLFASNRGDDEVKDFLLGALATL